MQTALANAPYLIKGLPKIDRYFPDCFSGSVEAVARHQFNCGDFGKIYGRHTFYYSKRPGRIGFRDNHVELDVLFHRVPMKYGVLESSVRDFFGIRIEPIVFRSFDTYFTHVLDSLRSEIPVITDFNLGFLKTRREYGKVFSKHLVVAYGYDPSRSLIHAAEMMLSTTEISMDDFRAGFEFNLERFGEVKAYSLSQNESGERQLRIEEVLEQANVNLENLDSEDATLGLRAIDSFRTDLSEYLESADFPNKPFSIPGLWVFSHERHVLRKWLRCASKLLPAGSDKGIFEGFDELLSQLFDKWLFVDFLMEKCLATGSAKELRNIPAVLDSIRSEESIAREYWSKLKDLLAVA